MEEVIRKKYMPCEVSYNFFYLFIRTTIVVLGSFLDTFQKIADAASNTKGNLYFTSNITIVIRSVIERTQIYLSFYDSMRNWTNLETGRSHISFKMMLSLSMIRKLDITVPKFNLLSTK